MSVSIITLGRGRAAHLRNLIVGLTRQTCMPDELVIGVMQESEYCNLPATPFPVRQVLISGKHAPLAAARNSAARQAQGEMLLFLDIDCIPAGEFVADYTRVLSSQDALLMGEVMYLPAGAISDSNADNWDYADLEQLGVRHCDRQGPPKTESAPCNDYRCFWSLSFAIRKSQFFDVGGFDERFTGYGGEDTDFGRILEARAVPMLWVRGAKCYHQYHSHHMPPVHHLDSVLQNAQMFREKWGQHTMKHWLHAFRLMGLIEPDGERFRVLRRPEEADFALTRQQAHEPYASSIRVMQMLQQREKAEALKS